MLSLLLTTNHHRPTIDAVMLQWSDDKTVYWAVWSIVLMLATTGPGAGQRQEVPRGDQGVQRCHSALHARGQVGEE
jgi:hypothetical protein